MSLVMAIANKNGIVVSGDRRLTIQKTYHGETEFTETDYTDRAQKIYKTKSGHAFGIAGAAMLDNQMYTCDALYKLVLKLDELNFPIKDEVRFIKDNLSSLSGNPIYIIGAGAENGINYIYETNTTSDDIVDKVKQGCYGLGLIGAGYTAICAFKNMKINTSDYSLEELSDVLKRINIEVSKTVSTVSEESDAIIIAPTSDCCWRKDELARIYALKT